MKRKLIELIKIPKVSDDAFLCFLEGRKHIPFAIKRVYYILEPKSGLPRGKHAHFKNRQVLFCIRGRVKMALDNGTRREGVILDKPEVGIFLDRLVWHEMKDMSKNTILLVLASEEYDADDYIRDYDQFLGVVGAKKIN